MKRLTWLHLSDLHFCEPKTGWDAQGVLDKLKDDFTYLETEHEILPDMICFTGDLAFGQVNNEPGWSLADQYHEVGKFLEGTRTAFSREIPKDHIFIVPGNHDVNRDSVTEMQSMWLDSLKNEQKIIEMIQKNTQMWKDCIRRMDEYGKFLSESGYSHLLTDPHRFVYALKCSVRDMCIGIGGFNSAWSCSRPSSEEKGKLWMGADWQIKTILRQLKECDITLALMHHPPNWFTEGEDKPFLRSIVSQFTFCLHGHEHYDQWVWPHPNGHTTISAGACYGGRKEPSGYNIVRLDWDKGIGEVWLRKYEDKGGGWVANEFPEARGGRWVLKNQTWIQPSEIAGSTHDLEEPASEASSGSGVISASVIAIGKGATAAGPGAVLLNGNMGGNFIQGNYNQIITVTDSGKKNSMKRHPTLK